MYGIHTLNLYPLYFKAVSLARQGPFQPRQKSIKGFQVYTPWKFNIALANLLFQKERTVFQLTFFLGFELFNFGCVYFLLYTYTFGLKNHALQ